MAEVEEISEALRSSVEKVSEKEKAVAKREAAVEAREAAVREDTYKTSAPSREGVPWVTLVVEYLDCAGSNMGDFLADR